MNGVRRGMVLGLVLLALAAATPLVVRWAIEPKGRFFSIVLPTGAERRVDLATLQRLPQVARRGEYQNQFGNWKDAGSYSGVLLSVLLSGMAYDTVDVIAEDGYRVSIERRRVEDAEYPMAIAYSFDGVSVPTWEDGFRLVVLPEDGRVSNEEYEAVSAGSYWIRNVARIVPVETATTTPADEP